MNNVLHLKECLGCSEQIDALTTKQITKLQSQLNSAWKVKKGYLYRQYSLKNFKQALELTNKVADIAEQENHHPDIVLSWAKLEIKIITHKLKALTENDFILAAKIDQLD